MIAFEAMRVNQTSKWIGLFGAGLLFGCSVTKDMDQMKSETITLGQRTVHMERRMAALFDGAREATYADHTANFLEKIERQPGLHRKVDLAVHLTSLFEFQHWDGQFEDTAERRQLLFAKAIESFFEKTEDWFKRAPRFGYTFHIEEVLPPNEAWLNLAALSYAIGRNDPTHEFAARQFGFQPRSFLDLIMEGLRLKKNRDEGKQIPQYARYVLQNEGRSIDFLQLRHNFLAMMVLGQLNNFDVNLFSQARMLAFQWVYPFDQFNVEQRSRHIEWLREAEQTRAFLSSIGHQIRMKPLVLRVYRNAKLESNRPIYQAALRSELPRVGVVVTETVAQGIELKRLWDFISGRSNP